MTPEQAIETMDSMINSITFNALMNTDNIGFFIPSRIAQAIYDSNEIVGCKKYATIGEIFYYRGRRCQVIL